MNRTSIKRIGLKLALVVALVLPELANAQFFTYTQVGDVVAGFRKTGVNTGNYDLVVDLGSVTNFLAMAAGATTNFSQVSPSQITDAFPSGYGNLQWSAFAVSTAATRNPVPWVTSFGSFPADSLWYTLPRTSVGTQTQPPNRDTTGAEGETRTEMVSVGIGAQSISSGLMTTNADNNLVLVREPLAVYSAQALTTFISDENTPAIGDFGANDEPLPYDVENVTPASFTSAVRSDFYQVCPDDTTDPITGLQSKVPYFIGYFTLSTGGVLSFTRAAAATLPSAGTITSTVTNGFSPLQVTFTNTASGTITSWIWNFGNGTIITNSTGANVTATYATAGDYTVTLTVVGPGGSSTNTLANFIVTSPRPSVAVNLIAGKFVLSGTNCPAGVQYRILNTTNLAQTLSGWTPVVTNTFLSNGNFSYTNATTNAAGFFRLVSP